MNLIYNPAKGTWTWKPTSFLGKMVLGFLAMWLMMLITFLVMVPFLFGGAVLYGAWHALTFLWRVL